MSNYWRPQGGRAPPLYSVAAAASSTPAARPAPRPLPQAQARPVAARVASPIKEEWNVTHYTCEPSCAPGARAPPPPRAGHLLRTLLGAAGSSSRRAAPRLRSGHRRNAFAACGMLGGVVPKAPAGRAPQPPSPARAPRPNSLAALADTLLPASAARAADEVHRSGLPQLITREAVRSLEVRPGRAAPRRNRRGPRGAGRPRRCCPRPGGARCALASSSGGPAMRRSRSPY